MSGHRVGRAFLLKIGNGENPPRYETVAGLRATTESISADAVSITASGIFLGSAAEGRVRAHALDGTLADYELSFECGQKLHRRFMVQRLDYAGDYNGERNYTLQLESERTGAPYNPAALAALVEAAAYAEIVLRANGDENAADALNAALTAIREPQHD